MDGVSVDTQLAGDRPEGESPELGLLHIIPKSPLASGRYLPFGSSVVAVGRLQGDGARSVPRVTSGSQKTGCANRGLHVWTIGEFTPSAALGGRDRGISEGGGPKMPGALNRILEGLIPGIPADCVQSSVGSGMRMIWTSWWLRPGSSWVPMAKGLTVWPVALASSAPLWAARSTSCCWMVMEISARM